MKLEHTFAAALCALSIVLALPSAGSARDQAADARARQAQIDRQAEARAAALRAQQREINRQNDARAAAVREQQRRINERNQPRTAPVISSGTTGGYNVPRSSQTAIGSDRNSGGPTKADRDAMEKIQRDTQKLKERKQRP
ncbi:MAG: hypothetical protein NTV97_12345 [Alphaproteobacteria bacterium]|nr:hypothetical protein [Alphaproteobacteria bacterium]